MSGNRYGDREKAESEVHQNIKKATSHEETAPKQKHVRGNSLPLHSAPFLACIVYTWDYRTSLAIWTGLKLQPLHSDEVCCWKALIAIHKIIRSGHPNVLKEALRETTFMESLNKSMNTGRGSLPCYS